MNTSYASTDAAGGQSSALASLTAGADAALAVQRAERAERYQERARRRARDQRRRAQRISLRDRIAAGEIIEFAFYDVYQVLAEARAAGRRVRAVLYCRISTRNAKQKSSLDEQHGNLLALCDACGIEVIDVVREQAVGKSLGQRSRRIHEPGDGHSLCRDGRRGLMLAVTLAKQASDGNDEVVVLAETRDRYVRGRQFNRRGDSDVVEGVQADQLRRLAKGIRFCVVESKSISGTAEAFAAARSYQTKRSGRAGRPKRISEEQAIENVKDGRQTVRTAAQSAGIWTRTWYRRQVKSRTATIAECVAASPPVGNDAAVNATTRTINTAEAVPAMAANTVSAAGVPRRAAKPPAGTPTRPIDFFETTLAAAAKTTTVPAAFGRLESSAIEQADTAATASTAATALTQAASTDISTNTVAYSDTNSVESVLSLHDAKTPTPQVAVNAKTSASYANRRRLTRRTAWHNRRQRVGGRIPLRC